MTKNKKTAALFAIITLFITSTYLYKFHFSQKALALKSIKLRLFDGDSAKFESIKFNEKSKSTCGYLNAKNKYGAYTGFVGFILSGQTGDLIMQPDILDESYPLEEQLKSANENLQFLKIAKQQCNLS